MTEYCLFLLLLNFFWGIGVHSLLYELSSEERQELLDAHNMYRSDTAVRFGAANIQVMEWNDDLASMAAEQVTECSLTRSENLNSPDRDSIGENLALLISLTIDLGSVNFTELLGYWYSQSNYYNTTENECNAGCDQFLQMVWADTCLVGCGASICDEVFPYAFILRCIYAPSADVSLSTEPFVLGDTCSQCPEEKPLCENDLCASDTSTAMMGSDPHFSVLLPSGSLLCYTVQGKPNSIFNLIRNEHLEMNALFVPDHNPNGKVKTWLGQIGITMKGVEKHIQLVFTAATSDITIDRKVSIPSNMIKKLTIRNGKLVMMETRWMKYPTIFIEYDDAGLQLSIVFVNDYHLDLVWHSTSRIPGKNGGLVGQFLNKEIKIDEERQLLFIPGQEPIPMVTRPVWRFVERNLDTYDHDSDHFCWTTVHPSNQGQGIIKGSFIDYEVEDILSA